MDVLYAVQAAALRTRNTVQRLEMLYDFLLRHDRAPPASTENDTVSEEGAGGNTVDATATTGGAEAAAQPVDVPAGIVVIL